MRVRDTIWRFVYFSGHLLSKKCSEGRVGPYVPCDSLIELQTRMPKTKREPESDDDHAPEAAPGSAEVSESEDQLPAQKKQKQVPAKAASAPPASAKAGPSSALPEAKKDADGGTYYQLGEKKRLTVRTYKSKTELESRRVSGSVDTFRRVF